MEQNKHDKYRRTIDELLSYSSFFSNNSQGVDEIKDFIAGIIRYTAKDIDERYFGDLPDLINTNLEEWIRILNLEEERQRGDNNQELAHKIRTILKFKAGKGLKGFEEHLKEYSNNESITITKVAQSEMKINGCDVKQTYQATCISPCNSHLQSFKRKESTISQLNRIKPAYIQTHYY